MKLRFGLEDGEEKTQEVGCLGISQSYILCLEKRILKLRREPKKLE